MYILYMPVLRGFFGRFSFNCNIFQKSSHKSPAGHVINVMYRSHCQMMVGRTPDRFFCQIKLIKLHIISLFCTKGIHSIRSYIYFTFYGTGALKSLPRTGVPIFRCVSNSKPSHHKTTATTDTILQSVSHFNLSSK